MSIEDIKDYLKYYIGQTAFFDNKKWEIIGIAPRYILLRSYDRKDELGLKQRIEVNPEELKLELRRLSSITEEEAIEIAKMEGLINPKAEKYKAWWQLQDDSNTLRVCFWGEIELMKDGRICRLSKQFQTTHYLLSRGFWLFGDEAFEKGLIIDQSSIKHP